MVLKEFRIAHSTLIEHYQFIEAHLEGIYAAVSDKPFSIGLQEVERDSLGGVIREIRELENEKGISIFTADEYDQLRQIIERRNFWCHCCYFEMAFDRKTGGPAKVRDVQQMSQDMQEAEQWRDRLFQKKLDLLEKKKEEMKMQYKILASDLDKTLLRDDGTVSPENWEAIKKLQQLGVWFVPATGRAFEAMPTELVGSPLIRYYITSNGAMAYDKETGKSYDLALPRTLADKVLDKLYSYPVCVMLHAENRSCVEQSTHNAAYYESFHMNQIWLSYVLEKETPVPELKKLAYSAPIVESVTVFFKNREDLLECKAFFEGDDRLQVAQTDPYNLEICSARAGKGSALKMLAEQLSVPVEETIAVGDSSNDMTMIEAAGLGLAMSNAVPEIKAAADRVICSNEEHAIAYILEHYIH